jgi:small-conductance mechanosensitive channel
MDIEIYCFTKTILLKEWRQIRQRIFLKIMDIVAQNGAQIPYPITSVKLSKEQ